MTRRLHDGEHNQPKREGDAYAGEGYRPGSCVPPRSLTFGQLLIDLCHSALGIAAGRTVAKVAMNNSDRIPVRRGVAQACRSSCATVRPC